MEIKYEKSHRYHCIEETKIVTDSSIIYEAQDLDLNRTVCVKCVKINGNNLTETNEKLKKAMLEVRVMVEVSENTIHIPNIYSTYFDEKRSELYIIMQWISGKSLKEHMKVPELQFIGWLIKLCDILALMEKRNVYHKDIKPTNIMLDVNNDIYLIDFNISVSTPNLIEGTLHYKAPEMDHQSKYMGRDKVDIFAIGVMLYEFYTGNVPIKTIDYARNSQRGLYEWQTFVEPKDKVTNIPEDINKIVIKCMKLDPKQRFINSNDLKNELKKAERSIKSGKR